AHEDVAIVDLVENGRCNVGRPWYVGGISVKAGIEPGLCDSQFLDRLVQTTFDEAAVRTIWQIRLPGIKDCSCHRNSVRAPGYGRRRLAQLSSKLFSRCWSCQRPGSGGGGKRNSSDPV